MTAHSITFMRFINCYRLFKLGILSLFVPDTVARSFLMAALEHLNDRMHDDDDFAIEINERVAKIRRDHEKKHLQRMWQDKLSEGS